MIEDVSAKTKTLFDTISSKRQIVSKHVEPTTLILSKTTTVVNKFEKQVNEGISSEYVENVDIFFKIEFILVIIAILVILSIFLITYLCRDQSKHRKIKGYSVRTGYTIGFVFLCSTLGAIVANGMMISKIDECPFEKYGLTNVIADKSESDSSCQSGHSIFISTTPIDIKPILQTLKTDVDKYKKEIIDITQKTIQSITTSMKSILNNGAQLRNRRAFLDNNNNGCTEDEAEAMNNVDDALMGALTKIRKSKTDLSTNKPLILTDLTAFEPTVTTFVTGITDSIFRDIENNLNNVNKFIENSNFKCKPFSESFEKCHSNMCARLIDHNHKLSKNWYFTLAIFGLVAICGAITGFWSQAEYFKSQKEAVQKIAPKNDAEASGNSKSKSKTNSKGDVKSNTKSVSKN